MLKTPKGCDWLSANAKALEKYAGQWVAFDVKEGVVSNGATLSRVLRTAQKRKKPGRPYVFLVPCREDCSHPFPGFGR